MGFIEQILEPDRIAVPEASWWWVFTLTGLVTAAACWALLGAIRRLGPAGGEITISEFLKGLALGFGLLVLLVTFTGPLLGAVPLIAGLAQALAGLACIALLALDPLRLATDPPPKWINVNRRHLLLTPLLWLMAFPILLVAMFCAITLARLLDLPVTQQNVVELLQSDDSFWWVAGWYASAAVAAPLWEEFVFRVVLFGGLCRVFGGMGEQDGWRHPGRLLALLVSGGFFVLVHGVTEWTVGIIPLGVLTLFLTALYAHTRSIWPCVLFHAMHNGVVVTLHFFVLMP